MAILHRFQPKLFGTLLAIAGGALFVGLGWWQVNRAEEKRSLIARFESGAVTKVELRGDAPLARLASLPRYQRIQVSGRYDSQHQILLDNMPSHQGRPGYRVLTPFALGAGGWMLVDRGWVPAGVTRAKLPDIVVANGARVISGRLDELPAPGVRMGDNALTAATRWPLVMSFPQHEELQRALNRSVPRRIVLLDAGEPEGYERVWQSHFRFGPERHLGYAAQWLALAIAVVVIYLIMSFKLKTESLETESNDAR